MSITKKKFSLERLKKTDQLVIRKGREKNIDRVLFPNPVEVGLDSAGLRSALTSHGGVKLPVGAPDDIQNVLYNDNGVLKYNGKEVVQLYLHDEYASIDPDFEKLIRFKKVDFKPMESKIVSFTIYPKDLSFINYNNTEIIENGFFYLKSGDRKNQIIKEKFKLINYDQ